MSQQHGSGVDGVRRGGRGGVQGRSGSAHQFIRSLAGRLRLEPLERRVLLATYTVTTFNDVIDANDGVLSLREAIIAANAHAGADTVELAAGTYTLSIDGAGEDLCATGDLDVSQDLAIHGAGQTATIIDANQIDRVLDVVSSGAGLTVQGLTIQNGKTPNSEASDGGGIQSAGPLTLTDVTVKDCRTGRASGTYGAGNGGRGGGIYCLGILNMTGCTVTGNTTSDGQDAKSNPVYITDGGDGGHGGGIYVDEYGVATLTDCIVTSNRAGDGGKGSDVTGGGEKIYGGTGGAGGRGGAIYCDGRLTIVGGEFSDNTAGNGGTGGRGLSKSITDLQNGGNGGQGGNGGAICAMAYFHLSGGTVISDNTAGDGGAGGEVKSDFSLLPTFGGDGGNGGSGGDGGGIAAYGSQVHLDTLSVSNNTTGSGGTGGKGCDAGSTIPGVDGGAGDGGDGGRGGDGAVCLSGVDSATIIDLASSGNTTGDGGDGGQGGEGASGGDEDSAKFPGGFGGDGGRGGDGGGLSSYNSTFTMTGGGLEDNTTGAGGDGGDGGDGDKALSGNGGDAGSGGAGGGFRTEDGQSTFSGVIISRNTTGAGGEGGDGGALDYGQAGGDGGDGGDAGHGGGVYLGSGTMSILDGTVISDNTGGAGGHGGTGAGAGDTSVGSSAEASTSADMLLGATRNGGDGGDGGDSGNGAGICVWDGTATLTGITISGNQTTHDGGHGGNSAETPFQSNHGGDGGNAGWGGGLYNRNGTVTVSLTTISGNEARGAGGDGGKDDNKHNYGSTGDMGRGGGVGSFAPASTEGTLTIDESVISGNTSRSYGGGLCTGGGTTNVTGTEISTNQATDGTWGDGGGAAGHGGTLNITGGLVYGNKAFGHTSPEHSGGGGVYIGPGSHVNVWNSTIASNESSGWGGGIFRNADSVSADVANCTIIDNHSHMWGGGIWVLYVVSPDGALTITLRSSIVSNNATDTQVADVDPDVLSKSSGHNKIGGDPKLQALDWYGGQTKTAPPRTDSPVIDAGENPHSLQFDQRGEPVGRTYGSDTDIGAAEYNPDVTLIDLDTTTLGTGYETTYVEGQQNRPVVGPNCRIWNDSGQVQSARVALDDAYDGASESLAINGDLPDGITYTYDSVNHVVQLNGAASLFAYETALNKIVYANTSTSPDTQDRVFDVWPNHDVTAGDLAQTTMHIDAVDVPVVAGFGNALVLDGQTGYVAVDPLINWHPDWTFSAWIKPTTSGGGVIYSEGSPDTTLWIRVTDEQEIELGTGDGDVSGWATWATPAYVVKTGEWNFVAVALSGSGGGWGELTIWVNGQSFKAGLPGEFYQATKYGVIGANVGALHGGDAERRAFDGSIDEVRIWQTAWWDYDIRLDEDHTLSGDENLLAGYWPFDDGSGAIAWDATNNGNTGRLVAAAAWTPSTVPISRSTDEDTALSDTLFGGTDPQRSTLTFEVATAPAHGVVVLDADAKGGYSYTPDPHWYGADSFTFRASRDGGATWSTHDYAVDVTVNEVSNEPPIAGFGYAIQPNDHIEMNPNLNGLTDWTFSTWVIPDSVDRSVIYSEGSPDATLKIEYQNDNVYVSVWNEDGGNWMSFEAADVLRAGPPEVYWNFLAVTLSGGGTGTGWVTVYGENGTRSGELQMEKSADTQYAAIGANTGAFHGGTEDPETLGLPIDEVRLWDVALTEDQLDDYKYRTLTGGEDHLLSYWRMDEGQGSIVWDATGKGNDAVISGVALWSYVAGIEVPYETRVNTRTSGMLFGHDDDGDTFTYVVSSNPGTGTVDLDADTGHFVYTPNPGFEGEDSFWFRTVDSHGAQSPNQQRISITMDDWWVLNTAGFGNAVTLGGGEDRVDVAPTFNGLSDWTFEAWVMPMADSTQFIYSEGNPKETLYVLAGSNQAVGVGAWNVDKSGNWSSFSTPADVLTLNQWNYVAVALSGGGVDTGVLTVYVNAQVFTDSLQMEQHADTQYASIGLNVGSTNDGGQTADAFTGRIDEVRCWNVARTSDEIEQYKDTTLIGNEDGLLGYWHFDEGWGYFANDAAGKDNNGTLQGNAAWVVSTVPVPYATHEDTAVSGTLFGVNWVDGGAPEGYEIADHPQHGSVSLDGTTGAFTYTPRTGWYGDDSFTWRISDWAAGGWSENKYTASLTVDFVNHPPQANSDAYAGNEDTFLTGNVLSNDTDADGDTLTAQRVTLPSHGAVDLNDDGDLVYTPALHWYGTDTFTYVAFDGTAYSDPALVTLTVNPVDNPPVAGFGGALELRGGYMATDAGIANLTDWTFEAWVMPATSDYSFIYSEGNPEQTFHILATSSLEVAVGAWNADLSGNWMDFVTPANVLNVGEWNYLAITLSGGGVGSGNVTVYVNDQQFSGTLQMANDAGTHDAVLGDDVGATGGGTQGSDPFWGRLDEVRIWNVARSAAELLDDRSHTLAGNEDGLLHYWRFDDLTAPDVAWDAATDSADATLAGKTDWQESTVPVSCETGENTPVSGTLFGSDVERDPFVFEIAAQPANGAATVDADTGVYTVTPDQGWDGTDSFTFAVSEDGSTWSTAYPVSVIVGWVNQPPSFVAGPDETAHQSEGAQTVPGWATQISPGPPSESWQTVTFIVTTERPDLFNQVPAVSPDGTLTFTPSTSAWGTAHVTVEAHDDGGTANGGHDTSAPQVFTITSGLGVFLGAPETDYRKILYTDTDGTEVVITHHGCHAHVGFSGDDLQTIVVNDHTIRVTDSDGRVEADRITILDSDAKSRLKITADRGGDGRVRIGGLAGGTIGRIIAPDAILSGTGNTLDSIGRLELAGLDHAALQVSGELSRLRTGWASASRVQAGTAGRWRFGDYVADSDLSAAAGLARVEVGGSVLGSRLLFGDMKRLRVDGDVTSGASGASLCEADSLADLKIRGLLADCTIAVGVDPGTGGFFDGDESSTGGELGKVKIGGIVQANGGDPFGIVAGVLTGPIRVDGVSIKTDALPWSSGDGRIAAL